MTDEKPTPEEVANRIRQAGRYAKSRRALERLVETEPELWIPALIEAANQDLGAAGPTVEALLSHFSAVRHDFDDRFWLYKTILPSSIHFVRLRAELALWIIQQLNPLYTEDHPLLALMNLNLSHHLREAGRFEEALPYSRAALDLYETLVESDPDLTEDLVWAWIFHAQQLFLNRSAEAIQANLAAVGVAQRIVGGERNRVLGQAYVEWGATLCGNRRHKEALSPLRKAYRLLKQWNGPDLLYIKNTAMAAMQLGDALWGVGRVNEAQPFFEEALRGFGLLVAKYPGNYLSEYLHAAHWAAQAASTLKQPERNRALRYEAVQMVSELARGGSQVSLIQLIAQLSGLIWSLIDEQRLDEAENHVRNAIRMGRKWGRMAKSNPALYLGCSYTQLASICMEGYRMEEGRRAALRARLHLRQLPPENRIRSGLWEKVQKQMEFFRWYKKWYRDLTNRAGRNRSSS